MVYFDLTCDLLLVRGLAILNLPAIASYQYHPRARRGYTPEEETGNPMPNYQ